MSTNQHRGWHARGYLPHFDMPDLLQSITYRLYDALPQSVVEELQHEHEWKDNSDRRKLLEQQLDAGYGDCWLNQPEIGGIVEENWRYFDGERYQLLAWVIMPNHVHVLIQVNEGYPLDQVVKSWKSYTALKANQLLARSGSFWYPDYFDRFVRDAAHYRNLVRYIHNNPVKAGLVETPEAWRFSSARLWDEINE